MAHLLINKETNDKTGGVVSPNAIIGFDIILKWGTMEIHYNLMTYRSVADHEAGKGQIFLNEIPNYGIVKTMSTHSPDEYTALLGNGALAVVWLKALLIATGNFVDADLTIVA